MTPTYLPPARYFHSPGGASPAPAGAVNPARHASPAATAAYAAAWQQQQVFGTVTCCDYVDKCLSSCLEVTTGAQCSCWECREWQNSDIDPHVIEFTRAG